MKGFTKTALAMACMAGSAGAIGCSGGEHYRNLVDPCHMDRYSSVARQDIVTAFTPQVQNGRILDQTVFNYHFEAGTDKLHAMGMKKLDELVQRRPQPDTRLFLATAHDVTYSVDKPEEFGKTRQELDAKRVVAIQKYLSAATAGRPMAFEVLIHDPAETGISGVAARNSILSQRSGYVGTLGNAGSVSSTANAGGAGGAGGAASGQSGGQTGGGQQGGQTGGGQQGGSGTGSGR
jgi:hypothetical protein